MTAAGFTQLYLLKLCLVIVQITWIQFTKANIYINNSKKSDRHCYIRYVSCIRARRGNEALNAGFVLFS